MREVKLRVEALNAFCAGARQTARRLDRGERAPSGASIAFENMETWLNVLTPGRWRLLRALRSHGPSSIRALAHVVERDYRGVHADVMAMLDIGLIRRDEAGLISVPLDRLTAEMALDLAA